MKRKLISAFLIVHGLIHIVFELNIYNPYTQDYVGWTRQSWILSNVLGKTSITVIGLILWTTTITGFVVAGILLLLKKREWKIVTIVASFISLIAYLFLWDGLAPEPSGWIAGPVVSGVIILALLIFNWPKEDILLSSKEKGSIIYAEQK
jgi:hypothetical protein